VCKAPRAPHETSQRIHGRDAREGDYFVCICSTILLMKGAELVEPTADDLFSLTPSEFSLLQQARKFAARQLRNAQGGRG
jgi:hypothetical protein